MLSFQRSRSRAQGVNIDRAVQATAYPALGNVASEIFRCPLHPNADPLRSVGSTGNPEDDNAWVCVQCGRIYPLVDGIPDLLAQGEAPDEFREHEISQWDEQAAQYEPTRRTDALYQAAVRGAARALQPRPGELILDAACGTGMIVHRYFRPGLRLVCLDLSLNSLRRLRDSLPAGAACCVRGDLRALPIADGVFDRVLCANALQHLPDPAGRCAAFAELSRVVRPGGRVVVSVHNYSVHKRKAGWPKEGPAKGNSGPVHYLYRYDIEEFRELLAARLQVERVCGIGLPLPYWLKLSWLSRGLERLMSRFGSSAPWGNLLLGIATRQINTLSTCSSSAEKRPDSGEVIPMLDFILRSGVALLTRPFRGLMLWYRDLRFAHSMREKGRFIPWAVLEGRLLRGHGTLIVEQARSERIRVWWTPGDIFHAATKPPPPPEEELDYDRCGKQQAFVSWCYERYLHPDSGQATLTQPPCTYPGGIVKAAFFKNKYQASRVVMTVRSP